MGIEDDIRTERKTLSWKGAGVDREYVKENKMAAIRAENKTTP